MTVTKTHINNANFRQSDDVLMDGMVQCESPDFQETMNAVLDSIESPETQQNLLRG